MATLLTTARHLKAAAVDDALDLFDVPMVTQLISTARRASAAERLAAMPRLERTSVTLRSSADYFILANMEQPRRMPASLALPDSDDGRDAALVAAWLATKRSPHTRAAYLRDLAQGPGLVPGHALGGDPADQVVGRAVPVKR